MSCIAVVDDDPTLLESLQLSFQRQGYDVRLASDGVEGLALVREHDVDLLITDVNMPGLDGFSLCRRLREEGRQLPILILTTREGEIDEALGLDLGADDYVSKPFSPRVLIARVEALLRRTVARSREAAEGRGELVQHGPIRIDLDRLEVHVHDRVLEVTVTELRLLEALARRPGRVLSRERLLDLARRDDSVVAPRLVDTYVARLRRKIAEIDPSLAPIETVVGAGYRLRDG